MKYTKENILGLQFTIINNPGVYTIVEGDTGDYGLVNLAHKGLAEQSSYYTMEHFYEHVDNGTWKLNTIYEIY